MLSLVLTRCVSCADGEQVTIGKAHDRHHILYSHFTVTACMHRFYILIQPPFDSHPGTNYVFTHCSGAHALLSLALYVQFRKCRVYSILCRAVLLCSSVGSSGSSRYYLLHKHETMHNDTPARRSQYVRRKT